MNSLMLKTGYRGKDYGWLVAVAPDGMILAEKTYEKCFINNGSAIGALYMEKLGEKKLEMVSLEWYQAEEKTKKDYYDLLKYFPEKVYASLHDFGEEKFTKIKGKAMEEIDLISAKESEIQLLFTENICGTPKKKVWLGKLNAYLGNMGQQHLLNIAFAKANKVLEDTEYGDICWNPYIKKLKRAGEEEYKFFKRGQGREMAVLCITKRL